MYANSNFACKWLISIFLEVGRRESGSVERKCGIQANCQIADVTATLTTTFETILWYMWVLVDNTKTEDFEAGHLCYTDVRLIFSNHMFP